MILACYIRMPLMIFNDMRVPLCVKNVCLVDEKELDVDVE